MRQPYRDLYALFRHEPAAEAYFQALPPWVQGKISARYKSVDSMHRLQEQAAHFQHGPSPMEEIGGHLFPPQPPQS